MGDRVRGNSEANLNLLERLLVSQSDARGDFRRRGVESVRARLHACKVARHQLREAVVAKIPGRGNDEVSWSEALPVEIEYQRLFELAYGVFGPQNRLAQRMIFPEILREDFMGGDREEELRFLQELVRQVGPAVYNVYLLRRLRQRAGAVERARVARELHDGAVQSLIAMEMQVDVLKRSSESRDSVLTPELARIQGLLREEVLKLRELMQQMKSLDVDSSNLARHIEEVVERFQRETGISAGFVCEVQPLQLPQLTCREMVRIAQEGLVNIRKHSGAKHAMVRLDGREDCYRLSIEDDGGGFSDLTGRFTFAELEAMRKGPLVIRERVRLIGADLALESDPSRGSRLEVRVLRHRETENGQ